MIPKTLRFKCERCGYLKKRAGKCVWCGRLADFDFPVPVLAESSDKREKHKLKLPKGRLKSAGKSRGGETFYAPDKP